MPLQQISASPICLCQLKLTDSWNSGCAWVASGDRPGLGQALVENWSGFPSIPRSAGIHPHKPYTQQNWLTISPTRLPSGLADKRERSPPQPPLSCCCCPLPATRKAKSRVIMPYLHLGRGEHVERTPLYCQLSCEIVLSGRRKWQRRRHQLISPTLDMQSNLKDHLAHSAVSILASTMLQLLPPPLANARGH